MNKKPQATINPRSPRAANWLEVFGTDIMPVTGMMPQLALVCGTRKAVFMLALDALTEEQTTRLAVHISDKFGIPFLEVIRDLPEMGCPIPVEDVSFTVYDPFFL